MWYLCSYGFVPEGNPVCGAWVARTQVESCSLRGRRNHKTEYGAVRMAGSKGELWEEESLKISIKTPSKSLADARTIHM